MTKIMMIKHGKNRLFLLAMMTMLFVSALTLPVSAQTEFDCSAVTEIPASECNALVLLYNNGNGDTWHGDWLESNTPCSWEGITCENGSVVLLTTPTRGYYYKVYVPAEIADLTNLRRLNISSVPVELPRTIGQLNNLTHLTLESADLTSLPDEIGELSNLVMLDLRYNDFTTFPMVVTTLPALRELYFHDNALTEIPAEIGNMTTLRRLHLQYNNLTAVPAEIGNLSELITLFLNANKLTTVPATFSNLTNLEELDLANNQMATLPDSVYTLLTSPTQSVDIHLIPNPWDFDCELMVLLAYEDVPLAECEALAALYNSMGGENWVNRWGYQVDWFEDLYICLWDGVECGYEREHIYGLFLPENASGEIPAEIGNLTELNWLNLSHIGLDALPPEIGNLSELDSLSLGFNNLTTLPEEIGNLSNLKELFLRGNQLTELPTTIGDLSALEQLVLGGTNYGETPWAYEETAVYSCYSDGCDPDDYFNNPHGYLLYNCDSYNIDLECDTPESGNQLTTLPAEIGNLTNLTKLDVDHNQLTTLPAEIGNLTQLLTLNASHNQLTELPAEIGNLTALRRLAVHNNQLTAIPAEFGNITTTMQIDLSHNQLITIAADFTNMSNLNYVNVENNQLTTLPTGFDSLLNDALVYLSNNQLSANFDCTTAIQILLVECEALVAIFNSTDGYSWDSTDSTDYYYYYYYDHSLYGAEGEKWFTTTTPCSWSGVTCTAARITGLDLTEYGLSGAFPPELGNLTELTLLNARGNELTGLPAEIGNLTKLEQSDLSSNQIASLPAEIGNLSSLIWLNLDYNELTSLPAEIGNASNLESVSISGNNLNTLPATIGNLTKIYYLSLHNNQLTSLPDEIGDLTNLTTLVLSYNPLTSWPATVTNLENVEVSVDGLCGPDDAEIIEWLEDHDYNRVSYWYDGLIPCSDLSVAGQVWIERDGIDGFGITDLPIVSATIQMVTVGGQQIATVTTDPTGQYNFTTLPFGVYTLTVDTTTFTATVTAITDADGVLDNATTIRLDSYTTTVWNQDFSYFSCTAVTEIPSSECEGLLAIYNETGGRNWVDTAQIGWMKSNKPCSWAGVICEEGYVKELQLGSAGMVGDVPSEIGVFSKLTHLNLWDNRLDSVAPELVDLTSMEQLALGRNRWVTFPSHIDQLTNLRGLYLSDAALTTLPFDVGNMTGLEDLHLWENQLTELPAEIGNLINMERLILRENLLTELPSEVTDLTNLVRLDVKYNNLELLPFALATFEDLAEIDIQGNDIPCLLVGEWSNVQGRCVETDASDFNCAAVTEIPVSECEALLAIYNRTNSDNWAVEARNGWLRNYTPCSWVNVVCEEGHVKELQLVSVGLTGAMPGEIGAFTELTHLNLWGNGLTSLPAELINLTNLDQLNIGGNRWTTFPSHIEQLTSLTGLYISDAALTTLPFDVGNLIALEDLHLWENQLTELPAEIGTLTNMERLILRENQLTHLPSEVTSLINLVRLDVKYNNLVTLPSTLGTAENLAEIDIQGNAIPCSLVGAWTNIQGICTDPNVPLAVDMGEIGASQETSVVLLLFVPFVMAAVTKQALSQ